MLDNSDSEFTDQRKAVSQRLFAHLRNDPEIAERLSHIPEQSQVAMTYMGYLISALREALYVATYHADDALEQATLVLKVSEVLADTASWDIRAVERAKRGEKHPEFPALDIDVAIVTMLLQQYDENNLNHQEGI